jgi:hypothetical protein
MKLRIRGNSLRLRLLRGEVEQLAESGRVTETIQFGSTPAQQLTYSLETHKDAQVISANFADNKITITIPVVMARNWVETELVALNGEQSIKDDSSENRLKILIEKDFVCLDRKDDPDNSNAFPHPAAKCG